MHVTQELQSANNILRKLPFLEEMARELLATYGSPLYVYQGDRLCDTIHHITRSVSYPLTQFQFASVTNGSVALLQLF